VAANLSQKPAEDGWLASRLDKLWPGIGETVQDVNEKFREEAG